MFLAKVRLTPNAQAYVACLSVRLYINNLTLLYLVQKNQEIMFYENIKLSFCS